MARKKKASTLHYVEERLLILKNIKDEDGLITNVDDYRLRAKVKRVTPKSGDKSDYATNVGFSVKTAKDAELLAGMQEYNFIPLSDEARRKVELLKHIWNYHWLVSKTDKRLSRVIPEATTTGTGWMYEGLKTFKRTVNTPSLNEDWEIEYKKEVIPDYSWVWCEFIPFENFFIDGTDIENSNEAIWVKFWDRDEWINEHKLMNGYTTIDIPMNKTYTYIGNNETDPKKGQDDDSIITEMRYYNKSKDEFIVLVNWKEVHSSHIPYTHKELPFLPYYDYQVEGRIWGMGEFELLAEDIIYKDAIRSLSIDVIKAQMGVMAINDDIDFDENTFEYGPFSYMKVDDISGIKHLSPSISTNALDNAEQKVDSDIISKTWIDYKSQILTPWETATKTAAKSQTLKKRINLNLKINWYSFFERLSRLRLSNIRLHHSNKEVEIPVEGWNIKEDWTFEPLNGWYGSFTVKPDVVVDNYNIVPITESILWVTEERDKAKWLEAAQILWGIIWADGQPVFPWEKIWEMLSDLLWIDFLKLSWASNANKSWEQLLQEFNNSSQWISNDATNPNNPNFIPPEQRSWATTSTKVSGQANIKDSDVLG